MDTLSINLAQIMEDVFKYHKQDAVSIILKKVFELIMQAERKEYLKECRQEGNYNKGNGYYERLIKSIKAHFKVKVPRDRNGNFKPLILEIVKDAQEEQISLFHELYKKGLTTRDISNIMKKIYNYKISAASISNITKSYQNSLRQWLSRKLDNNYYFIFIDALNVNVRRDSVQKEQFYIALGVKEDLSREVIGVYTLPRETATGWRGIMKDLKERGLQNTLCMISDELSGLSDVIREEFPETFHQLCLVHKLRNVKKIVRVKDWGKIKNDWDKIFKKDSLITEYISGKKIKRKYERADAKKRLIEFIAKWSIKYPRISRVFEVNDLDLYLNYLNFPGPIQSMIYTTNWIENLNKIIRRTIKFRNSFPNVNSAMNLIGMYLQDYERRNLQRYKVSSFKLYKSELDEMLHNIHKMKT